MKILNLKNPLKIYEKLLVKECLKFLGFFLVSIYLLFFILDFSLRSPKFFAIGGASFFQLLTYYYFQISLYLNLFLSLGFLLTLIKVLGSMNQNNELLALQMAGLSKEKIIRPLFFIALLLSLASYLNHEFQYPRAISLVQNFKKTYFHTSKKIKNDNVQALLLKDNTKLVYGSYDSKQKKLSDVFWLLNQEELYHIKELDLKTSPPTGYFVDHFVQNKQHFLIKKESFEKQPLKHILFDKNSAGALIPFEERKISTLLNQFLQKSYSSSKEKAALSAHLNYKLALPLLPLLIAFVLPSSVFRFSRKSYLFVLTALALFLFIGFYTLLDALFILTENGSGSPFFFVWLPFLLLLALARIKVFLRKNQTQIQRFIHKKTRQLKKFLPNAS
ncbi:MAG: LptF/LptG family permease [Parachlamydiales bacterium]|jgi:lipopolysaccharide export LptBFGC system permease protein LptF